MYEDKHIPKTEKRGSKTLALIFIILFIGITATGGVLFFIQDSPEFSETENRNLAQYPDFSWGKFWSGDYMMEIDTYTADRAPFREDLIKLSQKIKQLRGKQNKEEAYYAPTAPTEEVEKKEIEQLKKDTATVLKADETFVEEKVERNKGLIIFNGRAMQIFGGNETMAKAYADAITTYQKELEGVVNIYVAIIPSSGEFYMPKKYEHLKGKEKTNIGHIHANLHPSIKRVDAHGELFDNQDKYLYFRTDHHWTGLGAYYAYRAFCKAARIKPMELSELEKKSIPPKFLGSLYNQTNDPKLAEAPDTVYYWKVPGEKKVTRFLKENQTKEVAASLWAESARGGNSYSVFLGADWPIMVAKTSVKSGRRALLVKNSYGNPFATFLSANFETVVIVDYRYCERGVTSLINEYDITDLIFMNGAFSANTPYHIQRIRKIMHGTSGKVVLEKKLPENDSIPETPTPFTPDTLNN